MRTWEGGCGEWVCLNRTKRMECGNAMSRLRHIMVGLEAVSLPQPANSLEVGEPGVLNMPVTLDRRWLSGRKLVCCMRKG